jgi:uncharacterized protein (TIGR02246 family)
LKVALALVLALVLAGCAGPQAAVEPAAADSERIARATEVDAALQAFMDTWERADVESMVAAFTPDAVIFDPTPPGEVRGADAIRAFLLDFFAANQQIAIELSGVRVATDGPVGWTTSRYRFVAREEGEERVAQGNLTVIFVKQPDDSYLAALFHASRLPESQGETGPPGVSGSR